jgi:hypothetical protein
LTFINYTQRKNADTDQTVPVRIAPQSFTLGNLLVDFPQNFHQGKSVGDILHSSRRIERNQVLCSNTELFVPICNGLV